MKRSLTVAVASASVLTVVALGWVVSHSAGLESVDETGLESSTSS